MDRNRRTISQNQETEIPSHQEDSAGHIRYAKPRKTSHKLTSREHPRKAFRRDKNDSLE